VSERDFISVRQSSGNATLQEIGAGFVPTLRLANGSEYPPQGSVEFVDNQVDPNTGTIAIRARFPNKEGLLLPGETVTALIRRNEARLVPVVPIAAVEESNEGKFVLIVDPADKIVVRPIKVSVQVDQDWVVEEGLTPGERVVVEGSQKVQPGMVVKPVEATR
ncbi:MAG TPA: efflux RND transporter periplasmic adaptor subunit, partial [Stellaceae bacterium]|nr:efflux RND transporter periplasmic adaptor subunit [Stellaceae bacterium]